MKKIQLYIFKTHKMLGLLLSLMFVVWFISGIVLIFEGFPYASKEKRFEHLSEFTPKHFNELRPPFFFDSDRITLELLSNTPVYKVSTLKDGLKTYDASTLKIISDFNLDYAKVKCRSYNGSIIKKIVTINDFDQWIPWSYYETLFPIYKCYMDDAAHTVIYISGKTGEIVQETTRKKRWCARFGAIPHWIYFKQLRLLKDTWRIVVIVFSAIGVLMTLSGIYVGIIRLRFRKHKGITPYKKFWYKWHHLFGLAFGLFVFTFILSGMFSLVNIPNWILGVSTSEESIEWSSRLNLNVHNNKTPKDIFLAINKKTGVRKIEWKTVFDQPQYRIYYDDYRTAEVYTLINNKIVPKDSFTYDDIKQMAEFRLQNIPFSVIEQDGYDNYYSRSAKYNIPSFIYKIEVDDPTNTWVYIDAYNGDILRNLNRNKRVRRWVYRFLHTFDIPILQKMDWLRKTILILLSIAGLFISVTGFKLSLNWLKRFF